MTESATPNMAAREFDLFPFIKTWDGTPSMSLNDVAICLTSAVAFHLLFTFSNRVFSDKKKAARIAPLLHAIYATTTSCYIVIYHSPFYPAPTTICQHVGPSHLFFLVSLGYFLFDLVICLREGWGMDWIIHSVFCVWMYGLGVIMHSLHRWGMMVLFYEFSTVFLHCYIFLFHFGYTRMGKIVKFSADLCMSLID